ncbi:MAG: hypothetical protein ACYTEX_28355 [Planctomycetota bacterium]|jgi:hypothetical protein
MVSINYEEFGKMWTLEDGSIRPDQFSIREAATHLIFDRNGESCGQHFVESLNPKNHGRSLLEAVGGDIVTSAAFSNITGQIVYSKILEEFLMPDLLWPQLCETVPTEFDGEKIPGIAGIGDEPSWKRLMKASPIRTPGPVRISSRRLPRSKKASSSP